MMEQTTSMEMLLTITQLTIALLSIKSLEATPNSVTKEIQKTPQTQQNSITLPVTNSQDPKQPCDSKNWLQR